MADADFATRGSTWTRAEGLPRAYSPDGLALVVSGLSEAGSSGGGIFAGFSSSLEAIDELPTTGLTYDSRLDRWLRALSRREQGRSQSDLVEYSRRRGRPRARRIAAVRDAHDVAFDGRARLVVDTHANALLRVGLHGPRAEVALPGEPDSWHLNCIEIVEGERFVSAFRRGGTYRQWRLDLARSGVIFSLASGAVAADGLGAPHSPRWVDGYFVACDSARESLVGVDPARPSERIFSIELGGFTRGLALDDDHFYVGTSPSRSLGGRAAVLVVDRRSHAVLDRLPVAAPEIYDVRLVPRDALSMLDSPIKATRAESRWREPIGQPTAVTTEEGELSEGLSVAISVPTRFRPGSVGFTIARIEHRGRRPIRTNGRAQMQLSYRWLTADGARPIAVDDEEPLRTRLPAEIVPGEAIDLELVVRAPAVPGRYRLRVAMVEEGRRWVDAAQPAAFGEVELPVR